MQPALRTDFSTITEQPNQGATRLQLAMLSTRYAWAAGLAQGKDVAEIACGAGLGLGWLARVARSVEAGDLDLANCRVALETYASRENIRVRPMDALHPPFPDSSLDLVLLFEAIYYLSDAEVFFGEARRMLRPGGMLLLATVNREWSGFNPSPFHTRYLTAVELHDTLARAGFASNFKAGFAASSGLADRLPGPTGRAAALAGAIPLKRLFYGPLERIPRELEPDVYPTGVLSPIAPGMNLTSYRTLYVEATKIP